MRTKLLILMVVLFAFSVVSGESELKKVTLQLKWKHQFQFAGYYAAIEKGFYKKYGLEVILKEAVAKTKPDETVFNGEAQFGITTSDVVIERANGKDVVILASIFQHSPQVLISLKDSGIEFVHDLIGKKVMFEHNAADIIAYLQDEGVVGNSYERLEHSFNINDLINGKVDAMTAYLTDEPFYLKEAGYSYNVLTPLSGGIDFYGDCIFTTERLIEKDPELVDNFLKASLEGWSYALKNPEEIINVIYTKYSQRHSKDFLRFEAQQLNRFMMPDVVEIGYTNRGRWKHIINTFYRIGVIPELITTDGFIFADYKYSTDSFKFEIIIFYFLGLVVVGGIAFFYYSLSRRLKNEHEKSAAIQRELIEWGEKFNFLANNANDVIWTMNEKGEITYVSPSVERLRGYTPEEVMQQSFEDVLTPESYKVAKIAFDAAIEKVQKGDLVGSTSVILEQPCKDGSTVWTDLLVSGVHDDQNNFKGFLGISRNITERKKASDILKESEERFRLIFENAPVGIFHFNNNGIITSCNNNFVKIIGSSREKLVGLNMHSLPDDRIRALFQKCLAGESCSFEGDYSALTSGKTIPVKLAFKPHSLEDGIIEGGVGIVEDITDRKANERKIKTYTAELEKLNAELITSKAIIEESLNEKNHLIENLEKLNSEKNKFFAIISHDLRSPFQSFIGLTEIMSNEFKSLTLDELSTYSRELNAKANDLFKLLRNLLEWARMQEGNSAFEPKKIDLKKVIHSNIERVKFSAQAKNIKIEDDSGNNLHVLADENMINSVVLNLLTNAIKFTPENGKVSVSGEVAGDKVKISVKDSGIGMDREIIDSLFKIDTKVSRRGTSGEEGTGLGLLLCKDFLEKNGGEISVESVEGKGSIFSFELKSVSA